MYRVFRYKLVACVLLLLILIITWRQIMISSIESVVPRTLIDTEQVKYQIAERDKIIQDLKEQLNACNTIPVLAPSEFTASALQMFRIIQFNIRNANLEMKDYPNTWGNRLPSIIQFFEEYEPNIVAIQELVVKSLNDLQTYLPQNYNILYASRQPFGEIGDENNHWNEMVSIVWDNRKLDLITFGKFSLCDSPQTFPCKFQGYNKLKWYRVALWGLFEIKSLKKQMLFVAAHLHGKTHFIDGFEIHSKQFRVIETQIHNILLKYYHEKSKESPLIFVSADWNTGQYREWWENITSATNNADLIQWMDPIHSWLEKGNEWNVNNTYHRFNGSNYHGENDNVILDWFLASKHTLDVINVNQVHAVTSFISKDIGNIYVSDHYPIVMDIELLHDL